LVQPAKGKQSYPGVLAGIGLGTGWRMDGELVEAGPNGSKMSF